MENCSSKQFGYLNSRNKQTNKQTWSYKCSIYHLSTSTRVSGKRNVSRKNAKFSFVFANLFAKLNKANNAKFRQKNREYVAFRENIFAKTIFRIIFLLPVIDFILCFKKEILTVEKAFITNL